ncbi:hypothetical protein PV683_42295 [Streptomyces sp. AK08-01B]|nr:MULTISPECIES: hypothetical protein [unclassified Streptomyces]MDX3772190.1 hypothetical protein [Streptomyces sp. AK08-01B]MDX3821737.1 hypothetical protein [Streptomyces sp. AK08-01A]
MPSFAVLEEELDKGTVAHHFEDERWKLARVQSVIRRPSPVPAESVGGDGVAFAEAARLVLAGPAHRALNRDEHAAALRKKELWPQAKGSRRSVGPGAGAETPLSFE